MGAYSVHAILADYREAQNALEESLVLFRILEQLHVDDKDVCFSIREKIAYIDRTLARMKGVV